jgi:hypothetical protein
MCKDLEKVALKKERKELLDTIELIHSNVKKAFQGCDWSRYFPKYGDMEKALFDIQDICGTQIAID